MLVTDVLKPALVRGVDENSNADTATIGVLAAYEHIDAAGTRTKVDGKAKLMIEQVLTGEQVTARVDSGAAYFWGRQTRFTTRRLRGWGEALTGPGSGSDPAGYAPILVVLDPGSGTSGAGLHYIFCLADVAGTSRVRIQLENSTQERTLTKRSYVAVKEIGQNQYEWATATVIEARPDGTFADAAINDMLKAAQHSAQATGFKVE